VAPAIVLRLIHTQAIFRDIGRSRVTGFDESVAVNLQRPWDDQSHAFLETAQNEAEFRR
jgi:hypothetical protein